MAPLLIPDEAAMLALGRRWGTVLPAGWVVFLHGNLGAGKTTLVRGMLAGMGYSGAVKSPTYTLIEPYQIDDQDILHLDLYRLTDPEELEYLGIRDYAGSEAVLLVEWPEKGAGFLPPPDLDVEIEILPEGRRIRCSARSDRGKKLIPKLKAESEDVFTDKQLNAKPV